MPAGWEGTGMVCLGWTWGWLPTEYQSWCLMVGMEGHWWVPVACVNEHGDQRKERHLLLLAKVPRLSKTERRLGDGLLVGPVWGFPVWGLLVRWYTTYTEIIPFAVATEPLHSQVDPQQYRDHLHKTASPCPQAQRTLKSRKENVKEQTTPPQAPCLAGSGFESDLRLKF